MRWLVCTILFAIAFGCVTATTPAAVATKNRPELVVTPDAGSEPHRAPSYSQIAIRRDQLTSTRWDSYANSLIGTHADDWSGRISDVSGSASDYHVTVDMDGDGVYDVRFDIDSRSAMAFNRGDPIIFSGTIDRVRRSFGYLTIDLSDVTFE